MRRHAAVPLALSAALTAACGASDSGAAGRWAGTVDTLPSGHVVVANTDDPLWLPGDEWQVVEELRIGRAAGEGPDLFGRIGSFEVDAAGRIWVLDSQAQELRVFGPDGEHILRLCGVGAGFAAGLPATEVHHGAHGGHGGVRGAGLGSSRAEASSPGSRSFSCVCSGGIGAHAVCAGCRARHASPREPSPPWDQTTPIQIPAYAAKFPPLQMKR